jgi:hypothetical protein
MVRAKKVNTVQILTVAAVLTEEGWMVEAVDTDGGAWGLTVDAVEKEQADQIVRGIKKLLNGETKPLAEVEASADSMIGS